jgi:peptidoglycan/LPS O-acetylase OafA/YrhL
MTSPQPAERNRYLDFLRAAAILRVIVYHMFNLPWMSLALPAMGLMFALGGSLMARSVDRSPSRAVTGRIRRLVPALWALGAVVVPAMFVHGWPDRPSWPHLLLWLLPVAQPVGNDWAVPATEVLWYLVTYLWLVLLSPVALLAYRRWPLRTLCFPLLLLLALQWGPLANVLGDTAGTVATNVATYGACWLVGFAHRDGALARVHPGVLVPVALACLGAGAGWAFTHQVADGGYDLNGIPLGQAFYSLGFVLLAMRWTPAMAWLRRVRPLDQLVTLLNARAVTVYLWHNPAIAVSFVVGDALHVWVLGDRYDNWGYLVVALGLLLVPLLAFGWVEDVAARRRPRLLPSGRRRRQQRPAALAGAGPPAAEAAAGDPQPTLAALPAQARRAWLDHTARQERGRP